MDEKILSPTEKLYIKARRYNWDNGYRKLYNILKDEHCDKGTALMMYWLSSPQFFTPYANEKECPSHAQNNYKFVKHIESIFESIPKEIIKYNPKIDGFVGKEKENIKSPIPTHMYEETKGEIYFEDIDVYS